MLGWRISQRQRPYTTCLIGGVARRVECFKAAPYHRKRSSRTCIASVGAPQGDAATSTTTTGTTPVTATAATSVTATATSSTTTSTNVHDDRTPLSSGLPHQEGATGKDIVTVVHEVVKAEELEEYTEDEADERHVTFQERVLEARQFLTANRIGQGLALGLGGLLLGTFLLACWRYYKKYTSARAQRLRQVDKNKLLVEELNKYLPDQRSSLSLGTMQQLRNRTGFTPVEIFRKYLWYLLRERKFDQEAVDDLVQLKTVMSLSDEDIAAALKERAQRIYDKYGTLMMNTEGMTSEGVERKATCRNLFSKMLFLTEHEPLLDQTGEAVKTVDLRKIFGATEEDIDKLRIVSLYDVDLAKLDKMATGKSMDE